MISRKTGVVKKITRATDHIAEIVVEVAGKDYPAINFKKMTGLVSEGDSVLLNTTAVDLDLGTGGWHFVMANLDSPSDPQPPVDTPGHIMKLRYTPNQVKVLSAEEPDSPYHGLLQKVVSLEGTPVICCSLHSMLPGAATGVKAFDCQLKTVYVMTDGAALPISFSKLVNTLTCEGLINGTVTTGHSFGGDLECVNIYSGLLAAKAIMKADVIIVSMGPGIVGTNTPYGFSGMEQAEIIHAANALGGCPIAVPRLSFADPRERHRGLSHHSRTVLGTATLVSSYVSLPEMEETKEKTILDQMKQCGIVPRHEILLEDGWPGLNMLERMGIKVTTMGRSIDEELEFFLASSCGGTIAAKIARGVSLKHWEGEKN